MLPNGATMTNRPLDIDAVEDALRRRRAGRTGFFPGTPTLVPLLLLAPVFAAPALLILQPVFTDEGVANDLLGGSSPEAMLKLSAVSSAFFAVWGPGTFLVSALSDRVGRKPVLLACALASTVLSFGCSMAPTFWVYAVSRTLLGVACGAQGAVAFLLTLEWALQRDNGLLTSILMTAWSVFGILLSGVAVATASTSRNTWRETQLALCLINAAVVCTYLYRYRCRRYGGPFTFGMGWRRLVGAPTAPAHPTLRCLLLHPGLRAAHAPPPVSLCRSPA